VRLALGLGRQDYQYGVIGESYGIWEKFIAYLKGKRGQADDL